MYDVVATIVSNCLIAKATVQNRNLRINPLMPAAAKISLTILVKSFNL